MSSKEIKLILKETRDAIQSKNFDVAVQNCQRILQEEPANYMAMIFMGAAYQDRDKKEAANWLRKAVSIAPGDPTIALSGLSNCAESEELPGIYEKLLKLSPAKATEYHSKLIAAAENTKNVKPCIDIFISEAGLSANEENSSRITSALKCLAKLLVTHSDVAEVNDDLLKSALEVAIKDDSLDYHVDAYKRYLKLLYKEKNLSDLLKYSVSMSTTYPSDVYPLEWICKVYTETVETDPSVLSNLPEPINVYSSKLLVLNPTASLAMLIEAMQHYKDGRYVNARDVSLQVLKLLPQSAVAKKTLAKANFEIGAYSIAERIFRQVKDQNQLEYGICLSFSTNFESLYEAILILKGYMEEVVAIEALARAYYKLDDKENLNSLIDNENNSEIALMLKAEYVLTPKEAIETLASRDQESYPILILLGRKHFDLENYDQSHTCLLKATRLKPYRSECFYWLGRIYTSGRDAVRARKCLEKCASLNPVDEGAVTHLSAIYKTLGEWDANETLLKSTLNQLLGSQSKWVLFQLGLHYLTVQKFDDAIHSFRTTLRYDVNNILAWEGLADSYFERGSYNSALKVYQKILEICPGNINAKLQIAIIKTAVRLYTEAIECFDELLKDAPDYLPGLKGAAEAHYAFANQLLPKQFLGRAKSHLQLAINHLQKAFAVVDQDMVWLWRLTANIFVLVGLLPITKSFLDVSGKLAAKEEEIVRLERKDLFEFAAKFYTCALKLRSEDNFLWYELALCGYHHGILIPDTAERNFELAQRACKQSIQYQPNRWSAWNLLGILNSTKAVNDLPLAQHCFIKALQIDRKSAISWTNLGVLYLQLENIKLANQAFQRAQQSNPQYANAWIGQAIIAEAISEDEEAMDLFRHCTQLDFHLEAALGYAHWVCTTLVNPKKLNDPRFKYAIEKMYAIPVASDAMSWYIAAEDENASVESLSYLGYLHSKQSLWFSAIKVYERASRRAEPQIRDKMLCNLGYSLLKRNEPNLAIDAFNSASEATFKSTVGLALAYYRANQHEDSYSVYNSALEWLAKNDEEKALILVAMSAMVYAFQGEADTKTILYQCIGLKNYPIQALFSACALGILHKDFQLSESILSELKKYSYDVNHCHHVAFLTAEYYSAKNQPRQGLSYLKSQLHMYPDRPLLRKVLAEYLLANFGQMRKFHVATSQMALGAIAIGLRSKKRNTSLEAAKSMMTASQAITSMDKKKSCKLIQKAIHLHPACSEAWKALATIKV